MKCVVDNNLPVTLVRQVRLILPGVDIGHIRDLGRQDSSDDRIREMWAHDPVVWVARDEDFWLRSPDGWAVVWIACHNPTLAFLRDQIAPTIASLLPSLRAGQRVMVTEDGVWHA